MSGTNIHNKLQTTATKLTIGTIHHEKGVPSHHNSDLTTSEQPKSTFLNEVSDKYPMVVHF